MKFKEAKEGGMVVRATMSSMGQYPNWNLLVHRTPHQIKFEFSNSNCYKSNSLVRYLIGHRQWDKAGTSGTSTPSWLHSPNYPFRFSDRKVV